MRFIIEDGEDPHAVHPLVAGDADRGQQVPHALGPRIIARAHRARHDERLLTGPQEVEEVGDLLEGIGALNDDGAACALIDRGSGETEDFEDIRDRELRRPDAQERLRTDVEIVGPHREGGREVLAVDRRNHGTVRSG